MYKYGLNVSYDWYNPNDSIVFCKTKEAFGEYSNMASGFPISIHNVNIRTSEALYQALKYPYNSEIQHIILAEKSPMAAKMVQKPFKEYMRGDWDDVRIEIMEYCILIKLFQNYETFSRILLASKDKPIIEYSKKDDFYGCKYSENGLYGQNVLGKLLMKIRDYLKYNKLTSVPFLDIENLKLFGKDIQTNNNINIEEFFTL